MRCLWAHFHDDHHGVVKLFDKSGEWIRQPQGQTFAETLSKYDKQFRADALMHGCEPSHRIRYREIMKDTYQWDCDVCGLLAIMTLFKYG